MPDTSIESAAARAVTAEALKRIVVDLHWMARRYADGRGTYATSLFNEHTRALLAMGVPLNATGDGTVWARDAGGRGFDGLTDEEAAQGRGPDWWGDGLQRRAETLADAIEDIADVLDAAKSDPATVVQAVRDLKVALSDPVAVFVNMKRGSIAVPALRSLLDLHAGALERWDRAEASDEHDRRVSGFLPPGTMPKTPLTTSDDENPATPAELRDAGITEPMQVGPWVIGWYDGPDGNDVQLVRWNQTLGSWETRVDSIVVTFKGWKPFTPGSAGGCP